MANKPKFQVSSISQEFTYRISFFSSLIGNVPGIVAPADPTRYAVCFINNDIAGTVRFMIGETSGVLGYCVKPDEQQWLNIKDHGSLPQQEWWGFGTTGSERITVIEVLQIP